MNWVRWGIRRQRLGQTGINTVFALKSLALDPKIGHLSDINTARLYMWPLTLFQRWTSNSTNFARDLLRPIPVVCFHGKDLWRHLATIMSVRNNIWWKQILMRRGFKLSGETMVDWFSRSFEKHEDMGPSHTMGANVTHYVELFSGAKLLQYQ